MQGRGESRDRGVRAGTQSLAAGLALVLLALLAVSLATAAPRNRARFPARVAADIPRIAAQGGHADQCDRCHTAHAEGTTPQPGLLLVPNDNQLCAGCHTSTWTTGSYAGLPLYTGSAHGASGATVWPGPDPPARAQADVGMCRNCHDPHGYADAGGIIPQLALQREEKLCLTCHDGSPAATQVLSEFQKPYRHPTLDFQGRHTGPGEASPEDFGRTPFNRRHAECDDCHNPHVARGDGLGGPLGADASLTTLGASRVAVLNGPAGTVPVYRFLPASDTTTMPRAEYQLCFKCHSSWTTAPAGQTDLARVLNPANPSYHPVEAAGADPGISPLAFATGWNTGSITRCGHCHGSDFGQTRGPHGSQHAHILRAPYDPQPGLRPSDPNELCFTCHRYEVYADPAAPAATRAASRWNAPGVTKGHAEHVGQHQTPCASCHVTHGSTTLPHLLVTGRMPGLDSWTGTATGGTCGTNCHASQSYEVNYAR